MRRRWRTGCADGEHRFVLALSPSTVKCEKCGILAMRYFMSDPNPFPKMKLFRFF